MATVGNLLTPTLIGHPYSPTGIGRGLRVAFAACHRVGIEAKVRDVWNREVPEAQQAATIGPHVIDRCDDVVNVFHLNGDEIEPALERMGPLPPGHNIVMPFWELPLYPATWARQLERFDEVWASSDFIRQSIAAVVDRPVLHMPLPTEVTVDAFCGRRQFGIPEDNYAFLFFFDGKSRIMRKNPQAVVECFRRLLASRPWDRTCLVMKLHGVEAASREVADLLTTLLELQERVVVIEGTLPEVKIHNLIRCCDAFVSLHRSEGYGLGCAEAMYLGLPVIATGWSGNMDFMTEENSALIDYELVPVPIGSYPHAKDQHWAEPDLDQAAAEMVSLIDDPTAARALGRRGSRAIRVGFSYRAAGLRYARRLAEIAATELGSPS